MAHCCHLERTENGIATNKNKMNSNKFHGAAKTELKAHDEKYRYVCDIWRAPIVAELIAMPTKGDAEVNNHHS